MKLVLKLIYIFLFCLCSQVSFASIVDGQFPQMTDNFLLSLNENNTQKTILKYGKLEGQVIVPQGFDPTSIVVQVGAIDKFNQTSEDFYTSPDSNGHFEFANTFTVGSSLNLIFWDKQGLLNKRAQLVYISKFTSFYTVYLEESALTSNIATSFSSIQDFTKAGLCGFITGLSSAEKIGSEVYLQDNSSSDNFFTAKYFDSDNLPNKNQNYLAENGRFCFFNVESKNNSFLYSLKLKLNNGSFKTFFVYLPSYTFSSQIEFDAKSSLYKPIQMYSWKKDKNYYEFKENNSISWNLADNIYFSTSYDYSKIKMNKKLENVSVYLPLSDEFLNIDYGINKNDNNFFIFQPRSALFSKQLINKISKSYASGQTYIDKLNPFVLKLFDPKVLKGKNIDNLQPIYNKNFGSLFLNLDTTDFKFNKKYIKVYLKNISGKIVSYFIPLNNSLDNKNELSGFFYNLPHGLYQLFVTVPRSRANCDNCTTFNENEKLLWSSLVESLPGKTQILTNTSENKIIIENKLNSSFIYENHVKNKINFDVIPATNITDEVLTLKNYNIISNIEYIKENSVIYTIDEHELCYLQISKIKKDKLNKELFKNVFINSNLNQNIDIKKHTEEKSYYLNDIDSISNYLDIEQVLLNSSYGISKKSADHLKVVQPENLSYAKNSLPWTNPI